MRGRPLGEILLDGACLGVLLAALDLAGDRFLVIERPVPRDAALVALLFAGVGSPSG